MIVLILGVLLWSGAHLFKRLAPDARARMGDKGRGLVALASLAGIVLMVIGYRMADGAVHWGRTPALVGINNLLVLLAVYLFAASGMKTWITSKIRHPQLTAVKAWALAHLLVNGDVPSYVLFGGLLVWAVLEVILINRAARPAKATGPFPMGKEIGAVVGAVVVFGVIAWVHTWLGYPVFG
ncbi:NnrU family protein [Maritimibacter sp. DP1N21-5]|uniref:NnrU family protein n=1 Tax=Maritimibacter sp. DP1N21-5 TaxID=2836867 RepID=UPI001C487874|nr:NnrU family protein [Maritimibacter sp. DP1N21-5]MBV7410825.1 NnrU family protein [Maritimibacter sp. DP1N21-5]